MQSGSDSYRIEIRAEPLVMRVRGYMKPDDTIEFNGVAEDGALVEQAKSCLLVVDEGTYKNNDTGDMGTIDPGLYHLSSDGLYQVNDD